MSAFDDELAQLCSRELPHARLDEERGGGMIASQTHALAMTIAVLAGGKSEAAATLLEGVTDQLYVACSGLANLGNMLRSRR